MYYKSSSLHPIPYTIHPKNNILQQYFQIFATLLVVIILLSPDVCQAAKKQKQNFYYETKNLLDISDPIGDDKGNGYYQYPLDKRLKRGTFDIKNFRVYEEGEVIVFEIQMRNYILRTWEDTGKSDDQGFVANLWDIYIDIDGIEKSGYDEALPGRSVLFADKMGWEKVVLISPMNYSALEEILREKTDELSFQDCIDDIVVADYVELQGDKVISKISKLKLPRISEKSGFQCFSLGYKNIVSGNRLLNRDIKAFPTQDDFGGGSNNYGEPTVIDMIVPNDENQYKLLNNFTTASFEDNIRYAEVPFVYANGNRVSPAVEVLRRAPMQTQTANPPVQQPVVNNTQIQQQPTIPYMQPVNQNTAPTNNENKATPANTNGFMRLQPNQQIQQNQQNRQNQQNLTNKVKQNNQPTQKNQNVPNGFMPVKKK